jgi:TPR repeat protein
VSLRSSSQRSDWTRIETKLEENLDKSLGSLQVFVAQVYWWGQGNVDRDESKCIKYLTKARDRGEAEAWYLLGGLHDSGDFDDVEKSHAKAVDAFKKAAASGHLKAKKWLTQYERE